MTRKLLHIILIIVSLVAAPSLHAQRVAPAAFARARSTPDHRAIVAVPDSAKGCARQRVAALIGYPAVGAVAAYTLFTVLGTVLADGDASASTELRRVTYQGAAIGALAGVILASRPCGMQWIFR